MADSGRSDAILGRTEPRVFTPPLRELTPDTTLGYDVIEFADDVLGVDLYPWQRWLLIHALEIVGDFGGSWNFRFRTVVVLIARQNGKTMLGCVLALFFLYMLGVGLILGTAQDLEQAEDTWSMVVEMAQANPDLAEEIDHVWFTNGAKRLQLQGGRQYRVKASTRRAGRGKSADLILLDELREHQTWDAWSALAHTGMARKNSIVWCMSNAGDGTSVVLRHLRTQAHRALGDPDGICADLDASSVTLDGDDGGLAADDTLGIFEWSAPPDAEPADVDDWAPYSNPSLGYGISMRSIRSAVATNPGPTTRTETMCQWETSTVEPPFPRGAWEAGMDPKSEIAADSPLWWGVDISGDRMHAAIAVCGIRPRDRQWHVELAEYRTGIAWIPEWFRSVVGKYGGRMRVALQGNGAPVSAIGEMIAAIDGVKVSEVKGRDLGAYCGRMWDAVAALDPAKGEGGDGGKDAGGSDAVPVRHVPQPRLDLAANIAVTRPMGDGSWAWDRRKSAEDISPLVAATMAYGLATTVEEPEKRSAYEDHDLMVL
ncbi:MAG: hypothetical protein IJG82_02130 [Atopobiaceae bacterium]|nr:hypothetical protein [Atopobiaceae bacterium]